MRVLLSSNHTFPSDNGVGTGLSPRAWPSGSGFFVHDLIAKGLAELGHEVIYRLPAGAVGQPPPGVTIVSEEVEDVDILHTMTFRDHDLVARFRRKGIPWVATCHLDPTVEGRQMPGEIEDNWIFVSQTLAHSLGRSRFVRNGIDPGEYCYSETKQDYLLFLASVDWAHHKGLNVALATAKRSGKKLVVAGTSRSQTVIDEVAELCKASGAEYLGDVRGKQKAELLANAHALLFPTRVNEAFGLVIAEALMSGTPAIASDCGACPELIDSTSGFLCRTEDDFVFAVERAGQIQPRTCRERALRNFHYLRMAEAYVMEYEKEIQQ